MKRIFILVILLLSTTLQAQTRRELSADKMSKVAIDTVASGKEGLDMIIFSNGTWEYINRDEDKMKLYSELNDHWNTSTLLAYKDIHNQDLPPLVEIDVINNLSEYHPPIIGGRISSKYGKRRGRNHNGIDIAMPVGTPLFATFDGRIRYAGYNNGGYGFLVIIRNVNGLESFYGHLSRLNVAVGDYVKSGQVIGYVGNTGRSYGNHLHYELRYKDQTFDPEFLIDFTSGDIKYTKFSLEKSYFNIYSRASEILDNEVEDLIANSEQFANVDSEDDIKKISESTTDLNPSSALYHKIKSGDTLGKLARKYGTTISEICRLNNITSRTILRLNRELRIR